MINKNIIILLIVIILLAPKIKKEGFIDKDLLYMVEPLLCDGFYLKIWLPFINGIKFCIPGIYFPKGRRTNNNPGTRDCRGFNVCEI